MSVDAEVLDNRAVEDRAGDRFEELARSPHFHEVVAANWLYLAAAVPDAGCSEGRHWALSCLPAAGGRARFSTLSIGGQETFAVFQPDDGGHLEAKVIVAKAKLESFGAGFDERGLILDASAPYKAGGPDQVQVHGSWETLAAALAAQPLRAAARALADRLLPARTPYAKHHNGSLADLALGRY